MNRSILCLPFVLLLAAGPAAAVEAACEPYLRAAEKTASQPARHTISEVDGGRMELIFVGGKAYSRFDTGKWQVMPDAAANNLMAAEKKLVAAIRSGEYRMSGCRKLPAEKIEGVTMTVYAYTLTLPNSPAGEAKVYIGADGLVHGQRGDGAVVRHRYRAVSAPAL
ncbi:hypothetical protein [Arenimonas sp. MALMAid1274]|uniref:hypothetical protein n=1 Tax=Arenimonas sp. MALMAid1274 TaxID=3411630 RepID=UPI003BA36F9E